MKYLINLIRFDAKLERFAEVFGDCLEAEDIQELTAELHRINPNLKLSAIDSADTADDAFYYLDDLTQEEIIKANQAAKLSGRTRQRIAAFFRFVNDAYCWDDLEDLERWETELFDTLSNEQQKNYNPIKRQTGKPYRSLLFFRFCHYLDNFSYKCVNAAADDLTNEDRLGYNLGLF